MAKLVIGTNKQNGVPVISKVTEKLPALGLMRAKDANGKLIASTTESQIIDLTGVTDVSDYALYRAYYNNTAISGAVDMSDLTTLSGGNACSNMFTSCQGITSVDLGSLTTVSGSSACASMFQGCVNLTSVNLSSLTVVSVSSACSNMFTSCTSLTSVDLGHLTTLTGSSGFSYAFSYCLSLTTVRIGNTTEIDFGTRTNVFTNMFTGCTQNIDVYAPAANQAQIEAFSGYPNFGATGTVTWHWNTAE